MIRENEQQYQSDTATDHVLIHGIEIEYEENIQYLLSKGLITENRI